MNRDTRYSLPADHELTEKRSYARRLTERLTKAQMPGRRVIQARLERVVSEIAELEAFYGAQAKEQI